MFIGTEIQVSSLVICIIILIPISAKFFRSGIPRFRVIVLSCTCFFLWFCGFILTLIGYGQNLTMLWEVVSFVGMISTLFMLFIGFYEILASPGM